MRKILTEMTQKAEIYANTQEEIVFHMEERVFLHLKHNQITLKGYEDNHSFRFDYFNSVPKDVGQLIDEIVDHCEKQYKSQKSN